LEKLIISSMPKITEIWDKQPLPQLEKEVEGLWPIGGCISLLYASVSAITWDKKLQGDGGYNLKQTEGERSNQQLDHFVPSIEDHGTSDFA